MEHVRILYLFDPDEFLKKFGLKMLRTTAKFLMSPKIAVEIILELKIVFN